jgi:hypothetical protein
MTEAEKEMVEYWDSVSDAVLAFANKYKIPPMYTIMEFCVDSDYPTEPKRNDDES